jgi:hypothetical protein
MNTEINKNIKRLIERLGISPYEFSKQIGNKRADNLYNILNEKVDVSATTLNKIFKKYPEYKALILSGEEDAILEVENPATKTETACPESNSNPPVITELLEMLKKKDEQIDRLLGIIEQLNKN